MDSAVAQAHAETALLTAQRIIDYRPMLGVTSTAWSASSNDGRSSWFVDVHANRVVTVKGDAQSVNIYVDGKLVHSRPASMLTRRNLAEKMCQLILNRRSIPPLSRANIDDAIVVAEENARLEFALGMRRLIRNGFPAVWQEMEDDSEKWATLTEAAFAENGEHIGFLLPEQNASVPLDIVDIYSVRYFEVANEIMSQFSYDAFAKAG